MKQVDSDNNRVGNGFVFQNMSKNHKEYKQTFHVIKGDYSLSILLNIHNTYSSSQDHNSRLCYREKHKSLCRAWAEAGLPNLLQ